MAITGIDINRFSTHLFWDVDNDVISVDNNLNFIIQRVLEYGHLNDWILIYRNLGVDRIVAIARELPYLDPKSLSFLSAISGIKKEKFKCYITKQSTPPHWNF